MSKKSKAQDARPSVARIELALFMLPSANSCHPKK